MAGVTRDMLKRNGIIIIMKTAGDLRKNSRISIYDVAEATNCSVEELLKIEDGIIDNIDPVAYLYYLNLYICKHNRIKNTDDFIDYVLFEL